METAQVEVMLLVVLLEMISVWSVWPVEVILLPASSGGSEVRRLGPRRSRRMSGRRMVAGGQSSGFDFQSTMRTTTLGWSVRSLMTP